jgi:hypothetical protein
MTTSQATKNSKDVTTSSFVTKLKLFYVFDYPLIRSKAKQLFKRLHSPGYKGEQIGFPLSLRNKGIISGLIEKSHERPMDLNSVLPWATGVDKTRPPKQLDRLWLYGTPYWDMLTAEQKLETAWIETARDVSMFIRFEQLIPPLYIGYINRYGSAMPKEVYEYLMVFSKEEIVHTLVFQRYMKLAGLTHFRPPVAYTKIMTVLPALHPCAGILYTLIIEWTAELAAMYGTQSDEVEPFTRCMFREHHIDEVRHIAFARRLVEDYFQSISPEELKPIRAMFRQMIPKFLSEFMYNAEIAEHTSFVFPVQRGDIEVISRIRNSEHYRQLNEVRFKEMFAWLRSLELM